VGARPLSWRAGKRWLHQEVGAEPADSGSANHAAFAVGNWNGGFGLQAHSLGAPSPIEDYLSVSTRPGTER